jgi:hypothetical protein
MDIQELRYECLKLVYSKKPANSFATIIKEAEDLVSFVLNGSENKIPKKPNPPEILILREDQTYVEK